MKLGSALLLLMSIATATVRAAPPSEDPLILEADKAEIDDKKGVSVYSGNVKLSRGPLTVNADKLTVYRDKQELKKVVAVGNPVHLHQLATATTKEIRGEGQRAEYDPKSGDVLLLQNAVLFQDRNEFRGNEIRYNVTNESVNATKGEAADQRVRIVIHPKNSDAAPAQ